MSGEGRGYVGRKKPEGGKQKEVEMEEGQRWGKQKFLSQVQITEITVAGRM